MTDPHTPASPLPEGRADGREAAVEALTTKLKRYAMARPVAGQIGTLGLSPAEIVDIVLAAAAPVVAVPEAGEWEEGQEGEGSSPPPSQNRVGICPECGRPDFNACQDCQGGNR